VDKGLATVCLSGTLEEKLVAAADAGFDAVELFEPDLVGSPSRPSEVREQAAALGLRIALYQPFRDFEAVPDAVLQRNLRRAEAKFDVMEDLGVDTVLACSTVDPESIPDDDLAAEQLHALAERAAARGLRVAYEALAWGRHVSEYDHAWRIVAAADHPALGVCLDSFHVLSRGSDPAGIRAISADKLFFLQLADAPRLRMDVLQWSRHLRCFPGQGAFDLTSFCGHVLAAGYDGPLSLEVFNDVFRQADPGRTAVDAMRSLLVLEDRLGLGSLPEAPGLRGYAFVELAVGPGSAEDAERILDAVGFRHVGPHRSKPVQRWDSGGARVLLNHGDAQGGGVAALAVESADAHDSVRRAEALLAPVLARRRSAGEADLAAVAAPDGTSVFFAGDDGEWLSDFVALGDHRPPAVSMLAIDHVALSQPFDAFDEAVLFYRTLLGLEPGASQDLAAPDGLVRSRALSDGVVRLALNVPVLGAQDEPAAQHVAFRCEDVLSVARAMREHGVDPLPIPDNYYDDLDARLELEPGLLAELRELDVLVDRDARGGTFLHCYTPAVGRVFFEVVERRGGYDGYGAADAPVRMAAQRRTGSPQPHGA
jgi:4-hydroxyphenylpyruvate dioxygenase